MPELSSIPFLAKELQVSEKFLRASIKLGDLEAIQVSPRKTMVSRQALGKFFKLSWFGGTKMAQKVDEWRAAGGDLSKLLPELL